MTGQTLQHAVEIVRQGPRATESTESFIRRIFEAVSRDQQAVDPVDELAEAERAVVTEALAMDGQYRTAALHAACDRVEALRTRTETPSEPVPDYTTMSAGVMLAAICDDAKKWADAFMMITARYDHPIDHADMIGWFANAIEHSGDVRRWRREKADSSSPAKPLPARSDCCNEPDAIAALREVRTILGNSDLSVVEQVSQLAAKLPAEIEVSEPSDERIKHVADVIRTYEFHIPGAGGLRGMLKIAGASAEDLAMAIIAALTKFSTPKPRLTDAEIGRLWERRAQGSQKLFSDMELDFARSIESKARGEV